MVYVAFSGELFMCEELCVCVFIMLSLQHLWRAFNVCRVTCLYAYCVVAVAPSGELFMYAVLRVCVCIVTAASVERFLCMQTQHVFIMLLL